MLYWTHQLDKHIDKERDMQPNIKTNRKNTYHRDGTVSYWDVYQQQWQRKPADQIEDKALATMTAEERGRIAAQERLS